ncbi:TonB-dependent receptor [Prolixibacteraceae bacterium JC049]|nr:TonB-dependent receptor [Prolixibacteraceae bacterium JC049]
MMTIKTILFQFVLMLLVTSVFGQRSISGVVKQKSSGETLPYATVSVVGTSLGTTTNLDGFFTLLDVSQEKLVLEASILGYKKVKVGVKPNQQYVVIEMEPDEIGLEEVTVKAASRNMMKVSDNIGQIAISPKNISFLPSIGEKDIFRSMQLLPGVSGSNEASSGLYVRGGTPDQNLVLFDGFTVYHVDHFYGFFSAFNSNSIKDVQLYKGGYMAKYGGRTSSVVELTGKTGNEKQVKGGMSLSTISANGYLEIPLWDKGSFLVAYRRSLTDFIKGGLYNDIFDLSGQTTVNEALEGAGLSKYANEPDFYFYDLNAKATLKPTEKDVISISFYNGKDHLDNSRDISETGSSGRWGKYTFDYSNDTKDLTQWGNFGVSSKWGRQWNSRLYSNLVASYSNYFSNRERFSKSDITKQDGSSLKVETGSLEDNDVIEYAIKNDFQYKLNGKNTLEFGAHLTYNDIKYLYEINDTISVIDRKDDGTTIAGYIQNEWKPSKQFSMIAGLRSVYYKNTDKVYWEPRVQAMFEPAKGFKMKAAYGKYNQFAKRVIREDVMQGSRDFWIMTDDEIVPVTSASHYILGASYENKNWLFNVEAYYKKLDGLSEYSTRIQQVENGEPFFSGTGTVKGVELLLQRKFGKFTGWVSYTLSEVAHLFPDINDGEYPAAHDQPNELKIVGAYELGKFKFSGTWVYASGKPYTAPVGGYTLTLLDDSTMDYVAVGPKNGFRLPDYHRLDLSVNYNFKLGKSKCELGLSLFNLYNRSNVWYKEFEKVEDQFVETDVNFIGFTPNLFFALHF